MNENHLSCYPILNDLHLQYEVLKQQLSVNRPQIADESSFSTLTTNLNNIYKRLSAFARDYASTQLYASNKIVKCFVLNVIDQAVKESYDDDVSFD